MVEVEAPAALLAVSDLLAQEEALEPLAQRLKRHTKGVVNDYIQSGRTLLKKAAQAGGAAGTMKQFQPRKVFDKQENENQPSAAYKQR